MAAVPFVVALALAIVVFELLKTGANLMAVAQDLIDSFNALSASVQALAAAYQAKPAGIDPASLDPVKAGIDQLNVSVQAVLNPPAPGA
jgi:hypothetical protein